MRMSHHHHPSGVQKSLLCVTVPPTMPHYAARRHDAALRLVLRTEFPGWGWWVDAANATTCWEGWSTLTEEEDHYKGSQNHG